MRALQIVMLSFLMFYSTSVSADERIKIGVSTALTGDAASFGIDIKNALTFMNDSIGKGRYELIFEDDKCQGVEAVSSAKKLIHYDKVKYVMGFTCNTSLLAAAPLYESAGVLALSSAGTSGDIADLGKNIFRLFPSDMGAAQLLFKYISKRHSKVALITEANEYPVMMARTMERENAKRVQPLELGNFEFTHGETDLRSLLLQIKAKKFDALFINANTDASFISVVKQLNTLKMPLALYAAYLPASQTVREALPKNIEGIVFANLPTNEAFLSYEGKKLMGQFVEKYGPPQSGFPVVPISFEAFRIFELAMNSQSDPASFLKSTEFGDGYIPKYSFDQHGAVQGIQFQMQEIREGTLHELLE